MVVNQQRFVQAALEEYPAKLLEIVTALNRALDEQEKQVRRHNLDIAKQQQASPEAGLFS